MTALEKLNFGIVGACGRGANFKVACDALTKIRIHAVCDINAEKLPATAELLGAAEWYENYDDMLSSSELDAVIIATPIHLLVSQFNNVPLHRRTL